MYPTSGLSGRPYQFCSSREQVTAWAPVVGRHALVGYADTKTAKSASGMPSPPGSVVQPLPLHTLQRADGDESSTEFCTSGKVHAAHAMQRNATRAAQGVGLTLYLQRTLLAGLEEGLPNRAPR